MTQNMDRNTLRQIADSHGLSKLKDAHLPEIERALAYAKSMAANMPDILTPSDEPAHIYPAGYFSPKQKS